MWDVEVFIKSQWFLIKCEGTRTKQGTRQEEICRTVLEVEPKEPEKISKILIYVPDLRTPQKREINEEILNIRKSYI